MPHCVYIRSAASVMELGKRIHIRYRVVFVDWTNIALYFVFELSCGTLELCIRNICI